MPGSTRAWSRRDFLKLFPTFLGSTILACSTVEQRAEGPPTLPPSAPTTLEPGTFAETIFMNGKVVTMDAADTIVQAVTIKEALRAHTMGAAYAAHEEQIKGSLESGKFADVNVWTEDPYSLPVGRLYNTTIDLTMVGGKIVYQKA